MYRPKHAKAKKPFRCFYDWVVAGCIELAVVALLMVIWLNV